MTTSIHKCCGTSLHGHILSLLLQSKDSITQCSKVMGTKSDFLATENFRNFRFFIPLEETLLLLVVLRHKLQILNENYIMAERLQPVFTTELCTYHVRTTSVALNKMSASIATSLYRRSSWSRPQMPHSCSDVLTIQTSHQSRWMRAAKL